MYIYIQYITLIAVVTGFRGAHRDAAMPPTSDDHASMEYVDSHPCPEDEEFFEWRPEAEYMEDAIGKFMEGMDKQELTGYAALHKLLEGLPVPVQKTAGRMTQDEALQGGFLRDLDEDEKKRFTPSALLLYKAAVEHSYITVHTPQVSIHFNTSGVHTGIY